MSLILPDMRTVCFDLFLAELSAHYPNHHIALVLDGAASHSGKTLCVPDNISLIPLPPYSPELNPVENFWKELKKRGFYNRVFNTLAEVEDLLAEKLRYLHQHPHLVQPIVGFSWILSALN